MRNHTNLFRRLEKNNVAAPDDIVAALEFNAAGLLPIIVQCAQTRAVLMMAWMNREALAQTLRDGEMVYFSRSRKALWKKGDTSGCKQKLVSLAADCDGDALLAEVRQSGVACHSGRPSCFYVDIKK